jgi:hypothetical protein
MILNSTKFGGNGQMIWKLVQTDRQAGSYIPPQTMFAGGIITDVEDRLKVMINSSCGLSGQLMEKIQYFSIHHFFFFFYNILRLVWD